MSDHFDTPIIDSLESLREGFLEELQRMAGEPRNKQWVKREDMEQAIRLVASGHFVTLACLAELLNRKPDTLRDNYLAPMVKEQELEMAFPQ